jgi:hypothetical protein
VPSDLGAPAARRALARLRFGAQAVTNVVACGPGPQGARVAVCRAGSKNANGATEAAPSVVQRLAAPPDYLPVGAVVGAPEPAAGAAAAAPEPEPAAGAAGGATGGASTTGVGAGAAEPAAGAAEPSVVAGAGAAGQPASMAAEARTAADSERRKNDIVVTSRRKVPIARRAETDFKSSWYGGGC